MNFCTAVMHNRSIPSCGRPTSRCQGRALKTSRHIKTAQKPRQVGVPTCRTGWSRPLLAASGVPEPDPSLAQQQALVMDGSAAVGYSAAVPWTLPMDEELGALQGQSLKLHFTFPQTEMKKYPVVVFYSGFLASAHWYKAIVQRLAGAGYVVVQYDPEGPLNKVWALLGMRWPMAHPDKEVPVFGALLKVLEKQNSSDDNKVGDGIPRGVLDMTQVFVAGHSRGGAVAGLVFSEEKYRKRIKAAYLLDPVDVFNDAQTVRNSLRPVGITPADLTGMCNLSFCNYKHFINEASGSKVDFSKDSNLCFKLTHMLFCDGGPKLDQLMNVLDLFSELLDPELKPLAEKYGLDAVMAEVAQQVLAKLDLRGTGIPADVQSELLRLDAATLLAEFSGVDKEQLSQLAVQSERLSLDAATPLAEFSGVDKKQLSQLAAKLAEILVLAFKGLLLSGKAIDNLFWVDRRSITAQLSADNILNWFSKAPE